MQTSPQAQETLRKAPPADEKVPLWRMWLEPRLRGRLRWGLIASGLIAAISSLLLTWGEAWSDPSTRVLLGVVLGLSVGCFALFYILRILIIDTPFCALCRQPRAKVEAFIAAQAGAICTACVPLALAALDGARPGPRVLRALRTSLDFISRDLDPRTPRAESSRLLAATLALHSESEMVRQLATRALQLSNPAAAVEAMSRIPTEERTAADRILLSVALSDLERYAEAIAELKPLELASLEPVERGVILNNLATFALKQDPGLSGEALARARAEAEESLQLVLPNATPEHAAFYRRRFADTRAALALRAGEPSVALALLEEAEAATAGLEASQWKVLGNAREALGNLAGAREAWKKAVELGHPEALAVREAKERLARTDS